MAETTVKEDSGSSDFTDEECDLYYENDSDYEMHLLHQQIVGNGPIQPYRFEPTLPPGTVIVKSPSQLKNEENAKLRNDPSRIGNTDWCKCSFCVAAEKKGENLCCKEIPKVSDKMAEYDSELGCMTEHPGFTAGCLNTYVLDVAYLQYKQQYENDSDSDEESDDDPDREAIDLPKNQRYRVLALRQLSMWCWEFVGRQNRQHMPSCCVHKIEAAFPDVDGDTTK